MNQLRPAAAVAIVAALVLTTAGCGDDKAAHPTASASPSPSMSSMDGMSMPADDGDGLATERAGYRLESSTSTLPAQQPASYPFVIKAPDGKPVTDFLESQTQKLHFYAIRADLTGFQHLHPTMAAAGDWTASLAPLSPGNWRFFASFTPNSGPAEGEEFVLSRTVTVPGPYTAVPLPPAGHTATVDGYTVTIGGEPMAGMMHELTASITRAGKPVTDLQPYLNTYAHLTAFHAGDQAVAHLHPATKLVAGHGGGPKLSFHAALPKSGNWRMFLQFQTGGKLHTAVLTLQVA